MGGRWGKGWAGGGVRGGREVGKGWCHPRNDSFKYFANSIGTPNLKSLPIGLLEAIDKK